MRAHIQVTRPGRHPCAVATLLLGLACGLVFAVGGSLVLAAAPAFAAPPEKPETGKASAVTATTATLEGGVLNPKAQGEAGESEYRFRVSETECEGESSTPPEKAVGNEKEAIPPVALTNLQPNAHYTFCLIEHNLAGEYSLPSTPEHFITQAAKPTFESEPSSQLTQTTVTLEANINPNNQATTCKFEYGTSATLSGAVSVPCEPATLEGFPGQHASAHVTGLSPNTVYYYRVAAENGAGKAEGVPIQEVTTLPPLPTAATGEASMVTPVSAAIMGTVNPGSTGTNSEAFYFFEYSTAAIPEFFLACSSMPCVRVPEFPGGDAGQGTGVITEMAQLPGPGEPPLKPHTEYHYRIVAYNGNGALKDAFGAEREFKTLAFAPVAWADPPTNLSPTSATLTGSLDPQGVAGSYRFEYGTTTAYGTSLPEVAVAATETGLGVYATITGLLPDTTYHVRLVASNNGGATVTDSLDQTFRTYAAEAPSTAPPPPGFSLTGSAPVGPAAASFPNLSGLAPVAPPATTTPSPAQPVTAAEKLSAALKACKKDKEKQKRQKCEREVRKKYRTKAKK